MAAKTHTIEVDENTASALSERARARGVSVSRVVSELVDATASDSDEIAELDRRWASVSGGQATVASEDVVRWLETWGTPAFRPWSAR